MLKHQVAESSTQTHEDMYTQKVYGSSEEERYAFFFGA